MRFDFLIWQSRDPVEDDLAPVAVIDDVDGPKTFLSNRFLVRREVVTIEVFTKPPNAPGYWERATPPRAWARLPKPGISGTLG